MTRCRVEGCGRRRWHTATGLCMGHERRQAKGLPLGTIRRKEPRWTEEESDWMIEHLRFHSYASMGRALGKRFGFARTAAAVKIRAKRRYHAAITTADGHYSPHKLLVLLGLFDVDQITRTWAARGLRVQRTHLTAGSSGKPIRLVNPADLAKFLKARPEATDLSKVAPRILRQLGLYDLPPPPRCKVVRCKRGHENVVPLFGPPRTVECCRFCGLRMNRWAIRYTDEPATPFRVRSRLEDMPYYDAAADRLKCLICGQWKRALGGHVHAHGMGFNEYRRRFGLPADAPMLNKEGRHKLGHNWGRNTLARRNAE